jgi:hypothetical protein
MKEFIRNQFIRNQFINDRGVKENAQAIKGKGQTFNKLAGTTITLFLFSREMCVLTSDFVYRVIFKIPFNHN